MINSRKLAELSDQIAHLDNRFGRAIRRQGAEALSLLVSFSPCILVWWRRCLLQQSHEAVLESRLNRSGAYARERTLFLIVYPSASILQYDSHPAGFRYRIEYVGPI